MTKPQAGQTITLSIHGLGSSGEGVGHVEGYTVFVDGALPNERVTARLFDCHSRYGKAHLLSIVQGSPDRVSPPCPLFGRCGGCQIMHLAYEKQLEVKQQKVIDALSRIGHLSDCQVAPCLPSPHALGYRNKIQLPIRKGRHGMEIGLYAKGSHDLVEVKKCWIHCSLGEAVYERIRPMIQDSGIEPYDPVSGQGELRHLLLKSAVHTQEVLVTLVTNQAPSSRLRSLAKSIQKAHENIKGVVHNCNPDQGNVVLGSQYSVLEGQGFIQERICNLLFHVSPASFFQVNPAQAELLYAKALEFADLDETETVLDAYCGVGTLSLIFAQKAKQVVGVECVFEAIEDAKANARLNQIRNVSFVCAPTEKYISSSPSVDVALLNPPRKGCDPRVLEHISRLSPKKVVYISCDPATLARDLAILHRFGYKAKQVQPFDMFPQTAHVECVVQLVK